MKTRGWDEKKPRGKEGYAPWREGAGSCQPRSRLVAGEQHIQPRERTSRRGIVGGRISVRAPVIGRIVGVRRTRAGRTSVITIVIIAAIIVAVLSGSAEAVSVPVSIAATVIIIIVVTTIGVVVVMFVFPFC
mgnify:CR=1 FL=1